LIGTSFWITSVIKTSGGAERISAAWFDFEHEQKNATQPIAPTGKAKTKVDEVIA
jgi:hypothetical protein